MLPTSSCGLAHYRQIKGTATPRESSEVIVKRCSICNTQITDLDLFFTCTICDSPYHEICWKEMGGCATYGCKATGASLFCAWLGRRKELSVVLEQDPGECFGLCMRRALSVGRSYDERGLRRLGDRPKATEVDTHAVGRFVCSD